LFTLQELLDVFVIDGIGETASVPRLGTLAVVRATGEFRRLEICNSVGLFGLEFSVGGYGYFAI
jgi:hypothetical protein